MEIKYYEKILRYAIRMSPDEKIRLIASLADSIVEDEPTTSSQPPLKWKDYGGSAPAPLCGEDAQQWVIRTRRESDENRAVSRKLKGL